MFVIVVGLVSLYGDLNNNLNNCFSFYSGLIPRVTFAILMNATLIQTWI